MTVFSDYTTQPNSDIVLLVEITAYDRNAAATTTKRKKNFMGVP